MVNGNGNGHKIRVGWCPISECPACFPEDGNACRCGYRMDNVACMHPTYRRRWREAMTLIWEAEDIDIDVDQVEPEPEPAPDQERSVTARVSKARRGGRGLTPEEARERAEQLAMQFEEVRVEI